MTTTRLLLVDDDEFVRGALTRALDRTGVFSVLPAEHGGRALELLEREPVGAILTDLQMPVMDGLTMLGHLFERGSRLPVAVMTGQPISPALAQRLRDYGIAATFSKPVDLGTLADELQRALDPETVGRFRGITLFGFLQLLEVERITAAVVVHAGGSPGRLYFEEGRLVHAHTRRLQGLEAVYDILGWHDPAVEIFYKRRPRERTVREPLQHVLMEAARVLDERRREAGEAAGAREDGAVAAPAPVEPARPERDVAAVLDDALDVAGVVGVALVHGPSGRVVGVAGRRVSFDVQLAAGAAAELVRAQESWLGALDLGDPLEDTILTLGKQYHLIRPLSSGGEFVYLVLARQRANLGQARQALAKLVRRLEG